MVLSNAQRQKAYREKLKAIARGDMIGEQVEEILVAALGAIWGFMERDSQSYGDVGYFDNLTDWLASFAGKPDEIKEIILAWGENDGLNEQELAAVIKGAQIFEAFKLKTVT